MNDSLAQHPAQTPSPSTGSRQATQSVGSAMSSAIRAACPHAPRHAESAPRKCPEIERDGDASASMRARLASARAALKPLAVGGRRPNFPSRPKSRYDNVLAKGKGRQVTGGCSRHVVWFVVVCAAIAMVIPTRTSFAAEEPKTVLILHSYGQNFKPWSEYSKALRQELQRRSPWRLIIQHFSGDTARAAEETAE